MISVTSKSLAAYLVVAMQSWVPTSEHASFEKEDVTVARYESIAADAADVALDPSEAPLFSGEDGQVKTALVLTSIASYESHFSARVDDGREKGDHGTAYCILQVRPALGIVLDGGYYGYWAFKPAEWRRDNADARIVGDDLIADRKLCFRTGLHMARDSFRASHHLGWYTGEGSKEGPKAKARLGRAKAWLKSHPWPELPPLPEASL